VSAATKYLPFFSGNLSSTLTHSLISRPPFSAQASPGMLRHALDIAVSVLQVLLRIVLADGFVLVS
jgi:hypothetical protein